jgi:hypothetical protein
MTGWVLCVGKHTVTGVLRGAGVVGERHHSGYHRFFSEAQWCSTEAGLALMGLILSVFPKDAIVVLTVDDTLARHTGKHIKLAAMHRDPLMSTATKPFFHFGHNWVVLAVVIHFPQWNKSFSLPVLARLYLSEKLNTKLGRKHLKKTDLANEMMQLVALAFPERRFLVVGDSAYVNSSIVEPLPTSIHLLGRGRMDATLYAAPPRRAMGWRGRPRVKGDRLRSPAERAAKGRWRTVTARIYGKEASIQVQVFNALWYRVGGGRMMRFVLIRGWPGHGKDDVLVSTDLTMSAREIVEAYCLRWTIEETFGWTKQKLGLEDPHNRTERAVERTVPMALWSYSLIVLWYHRQLLAGAIAPHCRIAPWDRSKRAPSFSDMLATLRRECWSVWISDPALATRFDQKESSRILDAVGYA